MKKLIAIFALLASLAACAFTVEQYSPIPGAEFSASSGGALRKAEVLSGVSGGTVKLERILAVDVFTNAVSVITNRAGTFTVSVFSNLTSHVVYTNTTDTMRQVFTRYPYMMPSDTNLSTSVTALADVVTNTWSFYKETVTSKQTIFDGTLTGNSYSNAPANVYLMQGDRLIFTGTAATNGWIRLVLE